MSASPALGPFLADLECRLLELSADQLRAALVAHAERLPSDQRAAFLSIFSPVPASEQMPGSPGWSETDPDDPLLAGVDQFVESIESGRYFQGWGWDDELREERGWGDESWVAEMDDLFDEAAAAFLAGDLPLARDAYGRLLDAFRHDEEVGHFCGRQPATEMVTTDVTEAKARFLRALYETATPEARAGLLAEASERLSNVGELVGLELMGQARRDPLPALDSFLPGWIERLRAPHGPWFKHDAGRLLAEATVLRHGTEGLAALAREVGPRQPEAFLDWVDALVRDGNAPAAAGAGREALLTIPAAGETRARIAERLAQLAESGGDPPGVLDARREAWRASPTAERLVGMVQAGASGEVLGAEADRLDPGNDGRLAWMLLLMAGRADEVASRVERNPSLAWAGMDPPGPFAIPWLLFGSCKRSGAAVPPDSVLARLLTGGDRSSVARLPEPARGGRAEQGPASVAIGDRRFEAARIAIDARVKQVVGGQQRVFYAEAAALVVACAEAIALRGDRARALEHVAAAHSAYRRHSAFRAALEDAVRSSSILGPAL
jgi:hypothetical protein